MGERPTGTPDGDNWWDATYKDPQPTDPNAVKEARYKLVTQDYSRRVQAILDNELGQGEKDEKHAAQDEFEPVEDLYEPDTRPLVNITLSVAYTKRAKLRGGGPMSITGNTIFTSAPEAFRYPVYGVSVNANLRNEDGVTLGIEYLDTQYGRATSLFVGGDNKLYGTVAELAL